MVSLPKVITHICMYNVHLFKSYSENTLVASTSLVSVKETYNLHFEMLSLNKRSLIQCAVLRIDTVYCILYWIMIPSFTCIRTWYRSFLFCRCSPPNTRSTLKHTGTCSFPTNGTYANHFELQSFNKCSLIESVVLLKRVITMWCIVESWWYGHIFVVLHQIPQAR